VLRASAGPGAAPRDRRAVAVGGRFVGADLRLLELVGERVALAIGQAQLRDREQRMAETLQLALLPQSLPEVAGVELNARYLAHAASVGGDFYNALALDDGRLGVAIGDVTGKGLRAAVAMSRLRSGLHAYALDSASPADVLSRLGRLANADGAMATALYLTLDPATGALQLASAGHPPPLCIEDGRARFIDVRPALSPPLGLDITERRQVGLELPAGSMLVLYTDGLVERTPTSTGACASSPMGRLAWRARRRRSSATSCSPSSRPRRGTGMTWPSSRSGAGRHADVWPQSDRPVVISSSLLTVVEGSGRSGSNAASGPMPSGSRAIGAAPNQRGDLRDRDLSRQRGLEPERRPT
jgi:hypothetical protein